MATYRTRFGRIFAGGPCRDDYPNIVRYRQRDGWDPVVLQEPAMRSFKSAEKAFQHRTRHRPGRRPIPLTGSHRTCEFQRSKYAEDSKRFAHPDVTLHTRGLAIDVSTAIPQREKAIIEQALRRRGWKRSRPDTEPWHWSYFLEA